MLNSKYSYIIGMTFQHKVFRGVMMRWLQRLRPCLRMYINGTFCNNRPTISMNFLIGSSSPPSVWSVTNMPSIIHTQIIYIYCLMDNFHILKAVHRDETAAYWTFRLFLELSSWRCVLEPETLFTIDFHPMKNIQLSTLLGTCVNSPFKGGWTCSSSIFVNFIFVFFFLSDLGTTRQEYYNLQ